MTELAIPEASVAPYVPAPQLPVPPMNDVDSWTEIVGKVIRLSNEIYDTPFVPDGLRGSAAAVSACILAGREMGLGPMTSLANIDVIRGKPTQKPLLMRAMIQSRGHSWEDVEVNDTRVVVRGRRKGESEWATATFTADQARRAGLDLGKYPGDKLYARASSRLARRKFADVIMGIPYTPEDVEDGVDDNEIGTLTEGAPAAIEAPKPAAQRMARRAAPRTASPAQPTPPPASAATPPQQGAGEALPPLPGEDEADPAPVPTAGTSDASTASSGRDKPDDTDYDTPGTATRGKGGQLTALWTILSTEFGYSDAEKPKARAVCEHIVNRDLAGGTTGDLSRNEAKTVLDTLSHWLHQAEKAGEHPRSYMTALMTAQDAEPSGE